MNEAGIIQKIRRAISSESKTVFIRPDLELRDQITKTIEEGFDSIGDCLDAVNDFQEIRKSFLDSINDLYTHVDKSGEIDVNNEYFLAYLRSHFSIYKKLIFSKDNRNLNNDDFRRSVLLRNLMSFCIVKNLEKENTSDLQVVDPFFCDIVINALQYSKVLEKKGRLSDLRKELFLESVLSAFTRYINIDRNRYIVYLPINGENLRIRLYNSISSVCRIDPMRLFDHIVSYIAQEKVKPENGVIWIKVCVLGRFECENNKLQDLCISILNWYDGQFDGFEGEKTKLKLTFTVLKNVLKETTTDMHDSQCGSLLGHEYEIKTGCINYERKFSYSTNELCRIFDQNELVFIVDCPWLYREEVVNSSSGWKKSWMSESTQETLYPVGNTQEMAGSRKSFSSFYKDSVLSNIGRELYNMMENPGIVSSSTMRHLKNNVISDIWEYFLKESNKEAFIICSDYHAYRYSDAFVYPLTKNERYDGKDYSVIRYTGGKIRPLNQKNIHTTRITMDLWSVLKYLCMTYYCNNFEKIIKSCVKEKAKKITRESILEISRGIKITLDITNLRTIEFSLALSKRFERSLSAYVDVLRDAEISICNKVMPLINQIFKSAFSGSAEYGDDEIKTCMEMNLYNGAADIMAMVFVHKYKCAVGNNFQTSFVVNYPEYVSVGVDNDLYNDRFMDKKIYSYLLSSAEQSSNPNIYLEILCKQNADLYKGGGRKELKDYIDGVLKVCESVGETDSNLYNNLTELQKAYDN